jgi:hypothetical protein
MTRFVGCLMVAMPVASLCFSQEMTPLCYLLDGYSVGFFSRDNGALLVA